MPFERHRLCPVPGCANWINPVFVMCQAHWSLVPSEQRQKIWVAHQRLHREGKPFFPTEERLVKQVIADLSLPKKLEMVFTR